MNVIVLNEFLFVVLDFRDDIALVIKLGDALD